MQGPGLCVWYTNIILHIIIRLCTRSKKLSGIFIILFMFMFFFFYNDRSSEDVSYDLAGYPIEITKSLCEEIHKRLEYTYSTSVIIKDLVMNTTNEVGAILAGVTDLSGKCSGRQWKDKYGDYPNVVVNGVFTIGIKTGNGLLDISTGRVKLDSNTQCAYGLGECADFERGQYFWTINSHMNCEDKLLKRLFQFQFRKLIC